jgi:hypothetical protein
MAKISSDPSNNHSSPSEDTIDKEFEIPIDISIEAKDAINYYLGTAVFELLIDDKRLLAIESKRLEVLQQQNQEKERAIEIKRKSNEVRFNSLKEWMTVLNYGVLIFIFTIIGIVLGSILTFNSGAVVKCGSGQFFCQIFTLNKK